MKGAAFRYGLAVVVCSLAGQVMAADVVLTDNDRTVRNFTVESATVGDGKIRLEVRGMTLEDDKHTKLDLIGFPVKDIEKKLNRSGTTDFEVNRVNGGTIDLVGSYGLGANAEIGFDIPFVIQKYRAEDATTSTTVTDSEQDIGDVLMYGKFKREMATHCTVAGGLEMKVPTGVERKFLGTGELGLNPFLSTRYQRGRWGVGAHVGYQIYSGSVDDEFNFGVEGLLRGSELFALRLELAGRYFKSYGDEYIDVVVLPGIDFNLTQNFTIRPTGLANITYDALDWGVGIGFALTI